MGKRPQHPAQTHYILAKSLWLLHKNKLLGFSVSNKYFPLRSRIYRSFLFVGNLSIKQDRKTRLNEVSYKRTSFLSGFHCVTVIFTHTLHRSVGPSAFQGLLAQPQSGQIEFGGLEILLVNGGRTLDGDVT